MKHITHYFLRFLLVLFGASGMEVHGQATTQTQTAPYPGNKPEVCFETATPAEKRHEMVDAILATYKAMQEPLESTEGVWDSEVLKKEAALKKALEEYKNGKRGMQVKKLNLQDKTPAQIHEILLSTGFKHERIPLGKGKTQKIYWKMSGEETTRATDKDLVVMDIYTHADGSSVRVKPEGIPDRKRRTPLRRPHYTKSVLINLTPKCNEKKVCRVDTSYENEAFKLTQEGFAVPKSPRPSHGFRYIFAARPQMMIQADTVMGLTHFLLPTGCSKKAVQPKKQTATKAAAPQVAAPAISTSVDQTPGKPETKEVVAPAKELIKEKAPVKAKTTKKKKKKKIAKKAVAPKDKKKS